ncbi:uncharacterized protein Z520_08818 [Fonsecaea multimorphosa CBS 102226]|uniref:Small ribosomal subunit protein mS35 mitochondrial conserved domain-containing protein n=1 Tax=Fonsecaea multimorphosa CBS 102226 TaxID=1442371 RepID=A0A0D2IDT9_9EURO|nr:uncharacterized protein Z520_08818 [Fonsecaea multimorphosa CBS 102226]KIX95301.1 hypothetical protein Z520_08818 [Fonsecaea multimorphosa CBS 102226]OAL21100.1 hypothetical protein AYO22_08257 [Fonsecaea multimorphosa]
MATTARHLCRSLFQVTRQIPVKRKCQTAAQSQLLAQRRHRVTSTSVQFRQLSTSLPRRADNNRRTSAFDQDADDDEDDGEDLDLSRPPEGGYKVPSTPITLADLDADELADFQMLSPKDQESYLALQNHYAAEFEEAGIDFNAEDPSMERLVDSVDREIGKEVEPLDFPDVPLKGNEVGFWALDEQDDEFTQVEDGDEEWDESAISSVAHSELDLHREIREYTRVIAWDMPLLQQFAKPFTPPTEATPLRFRYTTYMGEYHPAARKVVVQFCSKDLPNLTEKQRLKLLKLVGPRYNPDTDVIKMSCETYEAPAQNKRYLGDLVKKLLDEARNGKDMMEDIPLDLRHHKPAKKIEFPEEWKLKPARVRELVMARQEQKLLGEAQTAQQGQVLDGKELVHEYVRALGRPGPAPLRQ